MVSLQQGPSAPLRRASQDLSAHDSEWRGCLGNMEAWRRHASQARVQPHERGNPGGT